MDQFSQIERGLMEERQASAGAVRLLTREFILGRVIAAILIGGMLAALIGAGTA